MIKCLLQKHEEPSSRIHGENKPGVMAFANNHLSTGRDRRVPRLSNYPRRISKPMPERDPVSTNKVDVIQRMIPQVVLWPPHVHTRARTRIHTLHSHVPPHTYAQRSFNPSAAHWQSKALQCSRVYIRTSQALGLLISYVT